MSIDSPVKEGILTPPQNPRGRSGSHVSFSGLASDEDGGDGRIDPSRTMAPYPQINYEKIRGRGRGKTGLSYHEMMGEYRCLWDGNYEENPRRFTSILERIKELGLHDRCTLIDSRIASEEEILRVHSNKYFDVVKSTDRESDEGKLEELSSKYDAIYFHPKSFQASLLSAGTAIHLVDAVLKGDVRNAFGLLRPPGHHAMKSEACGYCYFNNVAIAAKHALEVQGLERILIVDWDVHHGQATQFTFNDDPRVLYISIHRYEHGAFWPELIESNYNWTGIGEGQGYNCNIPLNETGVHDLDYLAIFHNVILPLAYRFDPQLVLVSAGFDAAIGCPEGEMRVSPATYAHFTHSLMVLAEGKIIVLLEGGYCIPSLSESAAMTLRSLLGDPAPPALPLPRLRFHKSVIESILDVIWALKPWWEDLFPLQGLFDRHAESDTSDRGGKGDGQQEDDGYFRPRHYPIVQYLGKLALLDEKPSKYETRNCYPVQALEVKIALEEEIQSLTDRTPLNDLFVQEGVKRTGISYHDLLSLHKDNSPHPERPARVKSIMRELSKQNLLKNCKLFDSPRYATDEEILLVHSKEHLDTIKRIKTLSDKERDSLAETFDSIYFHPKTEETARLAVGAVLQLVDAIMTNEVLNAFAVVRPPGHHARRDKPAGFCIFNNVAVAAEYAISKYKLSRVMIVDVDVHHGDGTQSIVQGREDISFISLHRYDYAEFYPSSVEAGVTIPYKNVINIPWNSSTMSESEYLAALFTIILPVAYEVNPELILVSAGFDAARNDPLGFYDVSPEFYGHLIHHLLPVCGGRLLACLEGGYQLTSISLSSASCVAALLGHPLPTLPMSPLDVSCQDTLKEVVDFHRSQHYTLQFGIDLPENKTAF